MKSFKKALAIVISLMVAVMLAVPAFADSITVDNAADGSEYAAFELLSATATGTGPDAGIAYEVNDKYLAVLQSVTGKATKAEILAAMEGMDADTTRVFADKTCKAVAAARLYAEKVTTAASGKAIFTGLQTGYYMIVETKLGNEQDTYSLVMLDTANGNVTISSKESTPTLEKKIIETNDSTGYGSGWQDGADYDLGDAVPFQLTGTVSNRYDNYEKYYYAFHDVMSAGLTFNPASVRVYIDGVAVTSGYQVKTTGLTDGCTFEVVFPNLKAVAPTMPGQVVVRYTATLNSDAVIGAAGNPNKAKLEYSNNPYDTGDGTTGKTPEDKVIAFTYKIVANKVGANNQPLENAGFTLKKFDKTTGEYLPVGSEITGVTTFNWERIDAGMYRLEETTVPAGYHKAEDLTFTVVANYDVDKDDPKFGTLSIIDVTGGSLTVDNEMGSVETTIVNKSGTVLPGTGGMGTTLFYVVGGLLMFGAAVLFITKKRMDNHN